MQILSTKTEPREFSVLEKPSVVTFQHTHMSIWIKALTSGGWMTSYLQLLKYVLATHAIEDTNSVVLIASINQSGSHNAFKNMHALWTKALHFEEVYDKHPLIERLTNGLRKQVQQTVQKYKKNQACIPQQALAQHTRSLVNIQLGNATLDSS